MANSKVSLYYFNFNGRAEICRLVKTYAGCPFEDVRFPREEWEKFKHLAPFGQAPFVKIDDETYAQSLAIAQYFARVHNLYGKTNIDALKIDQVLCLIEDVVQEVVKVFREPDETKKAEITARIKAEVAPKFVGFFENILEKSGSEHVVGDSVTLGDIALYDFCTGFLKDYVQDAVGKAPHLSKLVKEIDNNARIKAYRELHK